MRVLPLPLPAPQVAKPATEPDAPSAPSVKIGVPPELSSVKVPLAVDGARPAIRLGDSNVQEGVNGPVFVWFAVVIETTGDTTLDAAVPPTKMAAQPVYPFSTVGKLKTNSSAATFAAI